MKKKLQKAFALLLTVSMLISMMGVTAIATEGTDSASQIVKDGGKIYYNEAGTAVTATKLGENGAVVGLSKTIAGTALENEFDITLTVETSLKQEENFTITEAPDAAVLLTFDLSGTMGRDKTSDGRVRIDVAREAAQSFIARYAASAGNTDAKRMLAIVGFDTDAYVIMDWIDVNNDANAETAISNAFRTYSACPGHGVDGGDRVDAKPCKCASGATGNDVYKGRHSCTNFDGGMILSRNMLNEDDLTGIAKANTWNFILSDGAPTVTVAEDTTSVGTIKSSFWTGTSWAAAYKKGGSTEVQEIKNTKGYLEGVAAKANVFMIGVGVNDKPFGNWSTVSPAVTTSTTTGSWLSSMANAVDGTYQDVTNSTAMNNAFNALFDLIKQTADEYTITSSAWNAVDPIGAATPNHVAFMGFYGASGYVQGKTSIANDPDGDTASVSNNTINWDLKNSTYSESGSDSKTYTYSIKYRVRLTNEATGFTEKAEVATNGVTTFSYQTVTNNVFGAAKTVEFPAPSVEGYLADFAFTKENADGTPLKGAKFTLTHSGCNCSNVTVAAKTAESDENGEVKFENVPSGHTYVLTETQAPDGYYHENDSLTVKVAYDKIYLGTPNGFALYTGGLTVVNKPLASVTVNKVWDDNSNQDGIRPNSVTVKLLADNQDTGKTATLNADNEWTYTWTNLAVKDDAGKEIVYTVDEVDVPDGYEKSVEGTTITNTHIPATVTINGEKTWDDADNQDGKRPTSITINLMNGETKVESKTVTANDGWAWSFTAPKYANGQEIVYSITEEKVADYTSSVDGYNVTNSYTPGKTSIKVTKAWDDADNQDGIRPDSVTVKLLADDVEVANSTVELNADNEWTYTWSGLDEKKNGKAIVYTVTEDEVTGYTADISGDAATGFTITNTHTPATVSVEGIKKWNDGNNQDGIRPDSVTIKLLADDQDTGKTTTAAAGSKWAFSFTDLPKYKNGGIEIKYTIAEEPVAEYTSEITGSAADGFTVTNSHTPGLTTVTVIKNWVDGDNQDGIRPESITVKLYANGDEVKDVVLTAEKQWTHTWENLPKKAGGQVIVYTVDETTVPDGYTKSVDGFTITNTHATATTSVEVTKVWEDNNNQDGIRPSSITVKLLAGDTDTGKTVVLNADNEWNASFTDLPVKAGGQDIVYTVDEVDVSGYASVVTGDATKGFTITNTHATSTTSLSGKKVWVDGNDQDGIRPEVITVNLYANGEWVDSVSVNEELDNWTFTFEELPAYADGQLIKYTVDEEPVEGYAKSISGTTITNTHTPATIDIPVAKVWDDAGNQDGIRPTSVTVKLLADGTEVEGKAVTLNAENNWTFIWTELPVNANGQPIAYTVSEDAVTSYEAPVITGDAATGFTVTNKHVPATVNVDGSKTWDDAGNQDGKRPESITIRLLADGTEVDSKTVTADDNWAWNFANLPKYNAGSAISYTITEDAVSEYSTDINGYNVTNSYTPGQTSVTVTKVWDDANDQDRIRPESITVKLLAGGLEVKGKAATLTAENNWTFTWTELPEKAAGETIAYTVDEVSVDGYTTSITGNATVGFTITNKHTPAPPSIDDVVSVRKVWNDANNAAGIRPASVTVQLKDASGSVHGSATLSAANNWSAVWYVPAGNVWNVVEQDVPAGYSCRVTSPNGLDFTVTNTYTIDIPEEDPPLIDLEDDDVPLATPPATGDASILWAALSALSGSGLFLTRKKREDEE